MRRTDREVTDFNEIVDIIKRSDCVRLGFNTEHVPYILPLNFGIEVIDKKIYLYFHSALEGYKTELIKDGVEVSFECDTSHELHYVKDKCYCTMNYESVMGIGKLEILKSNDEKIKGLSLLMDHYHPEGEQVFDTVNGREVTFNTAALDRTMVYRLIVNQYSAKRK